MCLDVSVKAGTNIIQVLTADNLINTINTEDLI